MTTQTTQIQAPDYINIDASVRPSAFDAIYYGAKIDGKRIARVGFEYYRYGARMECIVHWTQAFQVWRNSGGDGCYRICAVYLDNSHYEHAQTRITVSDGGWCYRAVDWPRDQRTPNAWSIKINGSIALTYRVVPPEQARDYYAAMNEKRYPGVTARLAAGRE